MGVIGVFGKVPFLCSDSFVMTFHAMKRDMAERWAMHSIIGQYPVLEWIGHDLASVNLSIRLDSSLGVPPLAGLNLLKYMLKKAQSHVLLVGGDYLGKFVIESMSDDRTHSTGFGIPLVAEVDLKLKEFKEGATA